MSPFRDITATSTRLAPLNSCWCFWNVAMYGCWSGSSLAKPASMRRPAADQPRKAVARTKKAITTRRWPKISMLGALGESGSRHSRQRGSSRCRTPPSPTRNRPCPGLGASATMAWRSGRSSVRTGPVTPSPRRACPPSPRSRSGPGRSGGRTAGVASVAVSIRVHVLSAVARDEQAAAQPEGEHGAFGEREHPEEGALVGRRQRQPGPAAVVGSVEVARLGGDVERAVRCAGQLVQVEVVALANRRGAATSRRRRSWRAARRRRRSRGRARRP